MEVIGITNSQQTQKDVSYCKWNHCTINLKEAFFWELQVLLMRLLLLLFFKIFSEVFVEDPLFVCEVGQSQLSALESKSAGRRSVKERQQALIKTWCDLLEVGSASGFVLGGQLCWTFTSTTFHPHHLIVKREWELRSESLHESFDCFVNFHSTFKHSPQRSCFALITS
jgi:hypothetical protein